MFHYNHRQTYLFNVQAFIIFKSVNIDLGYLIAWFRLFILSSRRHNKRPHTSRCPALHDSKSCMNICFPRLQWFEPGCLVSPQPLWSSFQENIQENNKKGIGWVEGEGFEDFFHQRDGIAITLRFAKSPPPLAPCGRRSRDGRSVTAN